MIRASFCGASSSSHAANTQPSEPVMRIVLPNGCTLEGTAEQIKSVMTVAGITGKLYTSETKGLLLISEMDTVHIRNALLKKLRALVMHASTIKDNKAFVAFLDNLLISEEVQPLYEELQDRVKRQSDCENVLSFNYLSNLIS